MVSLQERTTTEEQFIQRTMNAKQCQYLKAKNDSLHFSIQLAAILQLYIASIPSSTNKANKSSQKCTTRNLECGKARRGS